MSYIVNFEGRGTTKPDASNPKGIKTTAQGSITVEGERPASNFDIPIEVIKQCKAVFMQQCMIEHYEGDEPDREYLPTVWLGKKTKEKAKA